MIQETLEAFDRATNPYVQEILHRWAEEDKRAIARAILETAELLEEFTADQVRERFPEVAQFRPNLISAMFSAMHAHGYIVSTGRFVMSDRPARHKSVHRIWRRAGATQEGA